MDRRFQEGEAERGAVALFTRHAGCPPDGVEALPSSGSARRYYRLSLGGESLVAACHEDARENLLFIDFSRHFGAKGLRVPGVRAVGEGARVYLQ
ncbi:MAG: hypothetical protein LBK12_00265, partial [Odoribacteraceae bacterium]|nr:hypothetical protein [Odoribacteraceae bacterium]